MFITFEGVEGSGKSTQARLLREFLIEKGHKVVLTREPGWGDLGKLIRTIILDEKDLELDPLAELYLFCADRVHHVKDFIKPKLSNGEIVICDRFTDSTIAYQGYGRRLELELVRRVAKSAALGVKPDLTILLDVPVKIGLARLERRKGKTKIDEEPLEFHEKIRDAYMHIAHRESSRIKIINGAKDTSLVQEEIRKTVLERM